MEHALRGWLGQMVEHRRDANVGSERGQCVGHWTALGLSEVLVGDFGIQSTMSRARLIGILIALIIITIALRWYCAAHDGPVTQRPRTAEELRALPDDRIELQVVGDLVAKVWFGPSGSSWLTLNETARKVWAVEMFERGLRDNDVTGFLDHQPGLPVGPSLEEVVEAYRAMGLDDAAAMVAAIGEEAAQIPHVDPTSSKFAHSNVAHIISELRECLARPECSTRCILYLRNQTDELVKP